MNTTTKMTIITDLSRDDGFGRFIPEAAGMLCAKLLIPINVWAVPHKRRDPKD